MTRHRRKSSSNNKWLILIQILIMAGVLVFIIFFRDTIGSGASSAFDTVAGTEDIQVKGGGEKSGESTDEELEGAKSEPGSDRTADAGTEESGESD